MKNNIKNKNKLILKSELLLKDIEKNANKINKQLLLLNKTLKLNNYYNIQMGGSLEKQSEINEEINGKLGKLEQLMNQVTKNSELIKSKTTKQTELITKSNEYLGKTLDKMTETSLESAKIMERVDELSGAVNKIKISGLDDDEYSQMKKNFSKEIFNLKSENPDISREAYKNITLRFICRSKANKSIRIIKRYRFVNKMISKMISDDLPNNEEWTNINFYKNYPENIFKMFDCINFLKEQIVNISKRDGSNLSDEMEITLTSNNGDVKQITEEKSKKNKALWKSAVLQIILKNNKEFKKLDNHQIKIRDEYKDKLVKFLQDPSSEIVNREKIIELINKDDDDINEDDIKKIEIIEKQLKIDKSIY